MAGGWFCERAGQAPGCLCAAFGRIPTWAIGLCVMLLLIPELLNAASLWKAADLLALLPGDDDAASGDGGGGLRGAAAATAAGAEPGTAAGTLRRVDPVDEAVASMRPQRPQKPGARPAQRSGPLGPAGAQEAAAAMAAAGQAAGLCGAGGWVARQAPTPAWECPRPEGRPLVLVIGEGKTGTTSVAIALAHMGLVSAHWENLWYCDRKGKVTADGVCEKVYHDDHRRQSWARTKNTLCTMKRSSYPTADWCTPFAPYDAVGDVPIMQLWPYIYMAHRKAGVKVIMTVRNASEWPYRRAKWSAEEEARKKKEGQKKQEEWSDVGPLGWLFTETIFKGHWPSSPMSIGQMVTGGEHHDVAGPHGGSTAVWGYLAEVALAFCLVPAEDLLLLDVFRESHEQLWRRLAVFLGKSPASVRTLSVFGNGGPK